MLKALTQEVKLLGARSMVGQGKYDEAYRAVTGVLSGKPSGKIRGMAYCVLGDLFAGRGQPKIALTAYLKVAMMYPETDSAERARAGKEAVRLLTEPPGEAPRENVRKTSAGTRSLLGRADTCLHGSGCWSWWSSR